MTASPTTDHGLEGSPPRVSAGIRRWADVWVLWLVAVGAQALILFLLAQFQLQQAQTFKLQTIVRLISEGDLSSAQRFGAEPNFFYYPTEVLVQFALVGLAVVLLAWVGRRFLAWTLPLGIVALSVSPAYVSNGPLSILPIGEGDDWYLWASLVLPPAAERPADASAWPLILGVVVQTALLLLPLIAAPVRRAPVPLMTAVRWTALPASVVAVVALTTLELPTGSQIYTVPLAAFLLTLLVGAIATGAGGTWQRLSAAVAVPAFIAPIVMPIDTTNTRQDVALGLIVAAASALLVLAILALPSLNRRAKLWGNSNDDAVIPVAP